MLLCMSALYVYEVLSCMVIRLDGHLKVCVPVPCIKVLRMCAA